MTISEKTTQGEWAAGRDSGRLEPGLLAGFSQHALGFFTDAHRCGAADMRTRGDRTFEGQHRVDVFAYRWMEHPQLFDREVGEVAAAIHASTYCQRHGFVGIAERQALLDQIVGQVGCGRETLQGRSAHVLALDLDAARHVDENAQRIAHGVGGVEQAFLVFLVIFVVGQRLAFHQGQHGDQVAVDAAGLATRQFGNVGVLFLRHDRAAGAEAVGQVDETDARAHPQHQLFRQAGDVGHDQRAGSAELDREVTVGHGIQRVAADAVKAECARNAFAVDRVRGAGQRGGAQRQAVDAFAAVGQTFGIAAEHFGISQQMVAERDRLGDLQVGEARHDGVGVLERNGGERVAQLVQQFDFEVDLVPHPEADVGGDLIVARAAGVQALAGIADQFGQAALDVQVHVFEIKQPFEAAGLDFSQNTCHAATNGFKVGIADQFDGVQHLGMCQRALDIEFGQTFVEVHRCGVPFDEVGNRFGETGGPCFGFFGELVLGAGVGRFGHALIIKRVMAGPESDFPRLLIVDRDATARGRLRTQLRSLSRSIPIQIVADAAAAGTDLAAIRAENPDIVLLDVLMPDCSGLELASALLADPGGPQVVLIVPSDDIAAQASGLDLAACLRRPLRTPLLSAALRQALIRLEAGAVRPETAPPVTPGLPHAEPADARHFLPVLDKGEHRAIPIDAVLYLRAELKYVLIRTADREYLTEEPLTALAGAFPGHFVRAHRNTLVARHAICGARRVEAGRHTPDAEAYWELALHGVSDCIPVSRRSWPEIKRVVPEVLQ